MVSYCTSYCHSGQTIINNFLFCEVKCICMGKVFSTIMLYTTSKELPNAIILPAVKVLSGLGWCKLSSTRIKKLIGWSYLVCLHLFHYLLLFKNHHNGISLFKTRHPLACRIASFLWSLLSRHWASARNHMYVCIYVWFPCSQSPNSCFRLANHSDAVPWQVLILVFKRS